MVRDFWKDATEIYNKAWTNDSNLDVICNEDQCCTLAVLERNGEHYADLTDVVTHSEVQFKTKVHHVGFVYFFFAFY